MYVVLCQHSSHSASTGVSLANASSATDNPQPSTIASVTITSPSASANVVSQAIDVSSVSTFVLPSSASSAHQASVDAPLPGNGEYHPVVDAVASPTAPSQVATNVAAEPHQASVDAPLPSNGAIRPVVGAVISPQSQVATNVSSSVGTLVLPSFAATSHQASVGVPLLGNGAIRAVVSPSPSPTNVSSSVGTLMLPSFAAATHHASVEAPLHGGGAYRLVASSSRQVASNVSSSIVLPSPSQAATSVSSQVGTLVLPSFVAAAHPTGTETSSTHVAVGHSAFTGVTFRSQAVVAGVGVGVDASPSLPAALSSLGSWCSRPGATALLTQEPSAITN